MVKYECKRCKKCFKQKCHYTRHSTRKFPCEEIIEILPECVMCNLTYTGEGHNPYPLADNGRCCNKCNSKVIDARFKLFDLDPDVEFIPNDDEGNGDEDN